VSDAARRDQVDTLSAESVSASAVRTGPSVELTDEEVVARMRRGNAAIFEVLMRRYNQRLYRAARAILGSDAEAEDAVQQAYLNAYRHLSQFEGGARFSTWLTRIAVCEALARRRQLSEGTIKTRLHRAKDLLQRKLQDVTPAESFRFDGARCDRLVAEVLHGLNP
jgi:DNA-directed RNA polymerase specialized sigma24 family protein